MKYFGILWLFSVSSGFPAVPQDAVPSVNLSNDGFIRSNKNLGDVVRYDLGGAAKAKFFPEPESFPDSGRKYAVLEEKSRETLPIQIDDKYGHLQNFIAGFYNPKPIVDTIEEYEKYGNDGSRHNKIGSKLVNGYETFSNIVNTVAEVPFTAIKGITKKISTSLDSIGGKIVGL